MKTKLLATIAVAAVGLVAQGAALAVGAGTGIVGSPHDFNLEVWNTRAEICRVCHVPHDHNLASQRYSNGLLWNHEVTAQTFTVYDNTWSSSIDGITGQPDGSAKLCLGCHDGSVAVDTFDNVTGGTTFIGAYNPAYQVPGAIAAGTDLHGTHPLSIVYDSTADPYLNDELTTPMGAGGYVINDVLDAGKVQCSSCHDVHDQDSVAGTHLLRVAQTTAAGGTASGLCLTCHNK